MIPEAAVEAAAGALRDAFDWGVTDFDKQARAALEAAAPHMLAGAWDEGVADMHEEAYRGVTAVNPYRTTK